MELCILVLVSKSLFIGVSSKYKCVGCFFFRGNSIEAYGGLQTSSSEKGVKMDVISIRISLLET